MTKRSFLTVLALGIVATAPQRVHASTDAEAAGYGGTSAGAWACGPVGRANYGGVGARVRVAENPGRFGGTGFTGEAAGAYEREETVADCRSSDSACVRVHSNDMLGAHARVGHQWEVFGFDAGVTAFQGYHHASDTDPATALFPDAEIQIGPRSVARGVLGIGSPTVTMLRRPGAYLGADVALGSVDLQARAGFFRAGPAMLDEAGFRTDVALYVPISEPISLRLGGAVGGNDAGMSGEGSAGIRGTL